MMKIPNKLYIYTKIEKKKYSNKLKDHSLVNGLSYSFKRSVLKL